MNTLSTEGLKKTKISKKDILTFFERYVKKKYSSIIHEIAFHNKGSALITNYYFYDVTNMDNPAMSRVVGANRFRVLPLVVCCETGDVFTIEIQYIEDDLPYLNTAELVNTAIKQDLVFGEEEMIAANLFNHGREETLKIQQRKGRIPRYQLLIKT